MFEICPVFQMYAIALLPASKLTPFIPSHIAKSGPKEKVKSSILILTLTVSLLPQLPSPVTV